MLGLNHYTSKYASYRPIPNPSGGWSDDQATTISNTDSKGNLIGPQAASSWLNVVPGGMYDILKWISARYGNPIIMITENGVISKYTYSYSYFFSKIIVLVDAPGETELPLEEALNDTFRVNYYSSYLDSVMKVIDEGVKVEGYFAWSLMVFLILYSNSFKLCFTIFIRTILNGLMVMIIASVYIMWDDIVFVLFFLQLTPLLSFLLFY